MSKLHLLVLPFCLIGLCATTANADIAKGTVYHDQNQNQQFDDSEPGIAGVLISNGSELVKTDENGRYEISLAENATLFVCKPNDWMTPVNDNNMPLFYYHHSPQGSPDGFTFSGLEPTGPLPDEINFPLVPHETPDEFDIVVFGDPQVRNVTEVGYLARDIVQDLIGVESEFGVSLGDLVFDDLSVFEPLNQVMGRVGIPWYNVHGNHDMNFKAADDTHAADTYKRVYGPTDFFYTYGNVHFIILDNVNKGEGNSYGAALGNDRLTFLKNIFAEIPQEELAVIMFHIPVSRMDDFVEFLNICEIHPNLLILSAHVHRQIHEFIGKEQGWNGPNEIHHLIHGTACGNWWGGDPDERGIPHATMSCGAPNGYSFITFADNTYKIDYRAASRDQKYQMDIHLPDAIAAANIADTTFDVNIFASSAKSTAQYRIQDNTDWEPLNETRNHIWTGTLPNQLSPGVYTVEVETIDMFDQTKYGYHILRVIE